MADYKSNKTCAEIDAILDNATPKGAVGDGPNVLSLQGARSYAEVLSKASLICAGRITALYTTGWATIGAEVEIYDAFKVKYGDNAPTITKVVLVDKRVSEGIGVSTTRFLYSGDYEGCYFVMGDFEGNDTIFELGATKGDWIIAQNLRWAKIVTKQREIAGIEGEVTAKKLAQRLSTPSEDNTNPLATVQDLESKTDIVASQIFLELHTAYYDFQVFSHKRGYEEHNREVCRRLIENCFTNKKPNNEVFFVTINGMRDGVPYMETAILESQASEIIRASFVKGNMNRESSTAAVIDILAIDAEILMSYAESGEDIFYWRYSSVRVPSIDAIGSESESDVYVTEFTFEEITTNGRAVNVSPKLVNAIYNKKVIVIPGRNGNYIATKTFSLRSEALVGIQMQIQAGVVIYDVDLRAIGPAPQTVQTFVRAMNLLSGTLNTINGASIASGVDMPLVSSISLNGKTYTPSKGAVDLGNIEGGGGKTSEEEISEMGFTKNKGTVTKVADVQPDEYGHISAEELSKKLNIGSNTDNSVNFANDLTGRIEATPEMFTYRPSAGDKSVRDESAVIRRIKGNTSVWSQLAKSNKEMTEFRSNLFSYDETTKIFTLKVDKRQANIALNLPCSDDKLSIIGHKYLLIHSGTNSLGLTPSYGIGGFFVNFNTYAFITAKSVAYFYLFPFGASSDTVPAGSTVTIDELECFDLTLIFGAGNEPTTLEEFRALYPKKDYPYSAPVVRAMRVTGIETIGFNAYNGEYAEVIGGQAYYLGEAVDTAHFATELGGEMTEIAIPESRLYTPSENGYIYATGSDICINLSHSGVRNGEYAPYEKNTLLLPEIAKYFPNGMHGIGDVTDEIIDGLAIQRCATRAYESGDESNAEVMTDNVTTVYKLSEPIYTPIDEPIQLDYKVDDFGTEKALATEDSAPFKADIVYQFNAEGRIRDNSRNIEKLEAQVRKVDSKIVQSDWLEDNPSSPAYIKNKPTLPTQVATATEVIVEYGIPAQMLPNVVYESAKSIENFTFPQLVPGEENVRNVWKLIAYMAPGTVISYPLKIKWRDGIPPTIDVAAFVELTFTSMTMQNDILGEWKLYK